MDAIIPWAEWIGIIQPFYYKGEIGNKPYPLETMLRIHMLQNLYDLSDMGAKYEVIDSRAFSEFCGVESSNQVPDGDTTVLVGLTQCACAMKKSTLACDFVGNLGSPPSFLPPVLIASAFFLPCFHILAYVLKYGFRSAPHKIQRYRR